MPRMAHPRYTVRWASDKRDTPSSPVKTTPTLEIDATHTEPSATAMLSSTAEAARARLASGAVAATHQIKRVAHDLPHSDFVPLLLTALLTVLLMASPFAAHHMKQQAKRYGPRAYDDRWQTDDPVDEFAKLARREWHWTDDTDSSSEKMVDVSVMELLLKDVFKSTALQHAAQDFVVQILQSERFKEAASRLVKELWSDLVSDPETIAQVVKLVAVVIQNPAIKNAVLELVLQLVLREPEIREALLTMIQNLSEDDVVRQAVVRLITQAAHTTLNDADILDHSMEFATDVVGDDVVQQTAGEALRKSVGYAVKPATTVLLTALGVGLLIFSVVAVGYSRSSEQEAVLFESAARSLHSNAMTGITRIVTWPLRAVSLAACHMQASWTLLWAPPTNGGTLTLSLVLQRVTDALVRAMQQAMWTANATGQWLHSICNNPHGPSTLATVGVWADTLWTYTVVWAHDIGMKTLARLFQWGSYTVKEVMRLLSDWRAQLKRTLDTR